MLPEDIRKACYFKGVLDYVYQEYDLDDMPDHITDEMNDYLEKCFESMMCYPNAAGEFCEIFKTKYEKN